MHLHEVSRKELPRALRILHALATEAERRGYRVACALVPGDSYGSNLKLSGNGQLVFTIGGHELKVRLWEKGCGPRAPYEQQMERWRQDRAKPFREMLFLDRPRPYDKGAMRDLNLAILGWAHGRQTSWGDRQRWRLEDRLPQLLRELETQATEAEERRLAKEREAAERRLTWEAAMETAKSGSSSTPTRSTSCESVLRPGRKQTRSAHTARLSSATARRASAADVDAERWLAFARDYANEAQRLPKMPEDPEVTRDALEPY